MLPKLQILRVLPKTHYAPFPDELIKHQVPRSMDIMIQLTRIFKAFTIKDSWEPMEVITAAEVCKRAGVYLIGCVNFTDENKKILEDYAASRSKRFTLMDISTINGLTKTIKGITLPEKVQAFNSLLCTLNQLPNYDGMRILFQENVRLAKYLGIPNIQLNVCLGSGAKPRDQVMEFPSFVDEWDYETTISYCMGHEINNHPDWSYAKFIVINPFLVTEVFFKHLVAYIEGATQR